MVSEAKLIKVGIHYTDKYFETLKQIYTKAYNTNKSLEGFMNSTKDYSIGNPLEANDFKENLSSLIVSSTNDIRFSRPAQKALMQTIIKNTTGELIKNVGDDVKNSVRDIVQKGYMTGTLSRQNVADEIESTLDGINKKRARTIARTEIKRAQVTSDYVISKERGANCYDYQCGANPCDICKGDCGKTYPIDDMEHLPPRHPNCYLPDTEVFTNHGWKYFTDITVDDKILSLNPEDNSIQFLDYVKVIETENIHGYMYHIYNKWFDICVTPDHDCFIHQRRDGGKHGRYMQPQFRKPSELTTESKFLRCIDTDRENPKTINVNGLEFKPEDYAVFMAWYISEGSVLHNPETAKAHGYPVKISQEITENREIIQPVLERIAESFGLRLAIGKSGFELYSKQLHDYLVKLGYSHEKYIPDDVFTLNKECLNIFLDNYVLGDGHERKCDHYNSMERIVFTSSPRLKDDLSYLILLCGFNPSIYVHTEANRRVTHSNGVYVTKRPVYGVRINRTQYTGFKGCTVEKIPYTGNVVCVELPYWHTLWVKRNGKTSWNGNCMCGVIFRKDPNFPPVEQTTDSVEDSVESPIKESTQRTAPKVKSKDNPLSDKTFENIFKKNPNVYQESYEHIDANWVTRKHKLTTYDYGDIKLSFEKGAKLTHKELVEHLSSLPSRFGETQANRITIYNTPVKNVGGVWKADTRECAVYFNNSKLKSIDTLTHEMAHTVDVSSKKGKRLHKYSDPKIYEKIFKADNKLYEYKGPTGRIRKPKKFPTEYAGKSYTKYKRKKMPDRLYVEDFAESSKLYLNPSTHKNFVKEFPNRAKYLESIYGKPVFKKNSLINREIVNENKIIDAQQKSKNLKKLKTDKFNSLTRNELDIELEKVLGNKNRVKSYHAMKKEVEKLDSVSDAIMMNDKKILINAGWGESTATKILANPNAYLPKVRQKKSKLKQVIEEVDNLVKDNLDLTKTPKSTSKPKSNPKTSTVKEPVEKAKTTKKETSSKKPTSSKKDNVDPVKRGIPKEVSQDTYYDHESFKTIKYEDGTTIKFKKSGNPEYPQQTLDEVTINGKTYKYKDNDVYDHFKYQDAQLTKEELDFADEFIEKYGTYAGQEFNSLQRGKLSKKDLEDIADDEAFKWLNENFERYNKILDKSIIEHDVVSMRIQAKNYVPKGATTTQDKAYTSSSVGISRTNLIDCFGNSRNIDDNWTYLTVTPKGTTGARFQGNSIARRYGSLEDDFERELTYKPNMKFDILLRDDKNKLMILQPH